jgi:hypothetical protein
MFQALHLFALGLRQNILLALDQTEELITLAVIIWTIPYHLENYDTWSDGA